METRIGHSQPLAIVEVAHVEPIGAVFARLDQMFADEWREDRRSVGRKAHQFIFARIDAEPGVVGKRAVEQSERMRKADFLAQFDRVATSDTPTGCRPFPHAVERHDRGFFERTRKERAGRVRLVVPREVDRTAVFPPQSVIDLARQMQLLLQPLRHGAEKREKSARREGHVSLEQPLEFQHRLFIEDDRI